MKQPEYLSAIVAITQKAMEEKECSPSDIIAGLEVVKLDVYSLVKRQQAQVPPPIQPADGKTISILNRLKRNGQ